MSEERRITSDDNDAMSNDAAPVDTADASDGGRDEGRIERLRELLTAPIRIPESESGGRAGARADDEDGDPEDYPAPTVDIPPHVRAAAEAAAHPGDDEPRRTKTGRKRRTWADAFLDTGRRDLSGAGGDAAAQLLTRLDELDRRTGQDIAQVRSRAVAAAEAAEVTQRDLEAVRAETAEARAETATRIDGAEQRITATADAADQAANAVDGLRAKAEAQQDEIARLTASLDAAEKSAAAAQAAAATAREGAAAATRKAGTATIIAIAGVVLALAALGAAFAL